MTDNHPNKIAIAGYGKVGRVLAKAFLKAGYNISGVVVREMSDEYVTEEDLLFTDNLAGLPKKTDFVVLSVRDNQVQTLAEDIVARGGFHAGTVVAHTAGAVSALPLEPVRKVGALPLAWHPMQTFIGGEGPELLEGVTFGIDGDPEAVKIGVEITLKLGGIPYLVSPEKRPVYHLAAVMACNMMSGLADMAVKLLNETGMTDADAIRILGPLMTRTAQNLEQVGLPGAISGPLLRGDIETIGSHLAILKDYPEIREVYCRLSSELLDRLGNEENSARLKPLLRG